VSGNYRLGDIRHNYADITLARQILGFTPQWSFDKGIEAFAKWVDGQEVQEDKYDASIEEMKQKGLYK
jgi:dTDP-L-rhamnose 4-epimerase